MHIQRKINATKKEIILIASSMFLTKGFSETSVKSICDELGISTGNLTFHYPTKEHMLAVLVKMLCKFQQEMMERTVNEGNSSLMAMCLELPTMAAICHENEIAKDFYISAYTHPMTLEIIRSNDTVRAMRVFKEHCSGWKEENFAAAENIVSGIEYATLITTEPEVALDVRVAAALRLIQQLYEVPEDLAHKNIQKVLRMDYRELGRRVLKEFIDSVQNISEEDLENILRETKMK